jgi:rod shape determining protein RodA
MVLLVVVGLMALYSEGYGRRTTYFYKQVIAVGIALFPFFLMYRIRLEFWQRISKVLYVMNLLILAAVLAVGMTGGGAQRWIDIGPLQFQPSEISKLLVVLTLSTFYANHLHVIDRFSTFVLGLFHVLIPMILVFKQPHLGATLVILFSWITISFYAGVPVRFLVGTALVAGVVLGAAFFIPGILRPYQKERVYALFQKDEQGSEYQQLKATFAFGTGGVLGTGYLRGQQKQGHFVPEQHTDFIFTVVGEEFGLVGCAFVLTLYGILFYRIWKVIHQTVNPYGRLVAVGILSILFFHTFANMSMNLHMGPVVGLWLPFISYGGTAILLCFASIGLLLQIYEREKSSMF